MVARRSQDPVVDRWGSSRFRSRPRRHTPRAGRRQRGLWSAEPWARTSYSAATPIFGDRDRSIQDDVNAVSLERRNGYSWFSGTGVGVSSAYVKWSRHYGS